MPRDDACSAASSAARRRRRATAARLGPFDPHVVEPERSESETERLHDRFASGEPRRQRRHRIGLGERHTSSSTGVNSRVRIDGVRSSDRRNRSMSTTSTPIPIIGCHAPEIGRLGDRRDQEHRRRAARPSLRLVEVAFGLRHPVDEPGVPVVVSLQHAAHDVGASSRSWSLTCSRVMPVQVPALTSGTKITVRPSRATASHEQLTRRRRRGAWCRRGGGPGRPDSSGRARCRRDRRSSTCRRRSGSG